MLRQILKRHLKSPLKSLIHVDGLSAFSPASLSGMQMWTADDNASNQSFGGDNRPYLDTKETAGGERLARQARCWNYNVSVSDGINLGQNLRFTSNLFTVCLWAKWTGSGNQILIAKGQSGRYDYSLICSTTMILSLHRENGGGQNYKTTSGGSSMNDGTWKHIVFTYDDDYVRIYLNGVEVGASNTVVTGTGRYDNRNGEADCIIGARGDGAVPFGGEMNEVTMWDGEALTAAEVLGLYDGTFAGNPPTNQWIPEHEKGTLVFDRYGTTDGYIQNATLSTFNGTNTDWENGSSANMHGWTPGLQFAKTNKYFMSSKFDGPQYGTDHTLEFTCYIPTNGTSTEGLFGDNGLSAYVNFSTANGLRANTEVIASVAELQAAGWDYDEWHTLRINWDASESEWTVTVDDTSTTPARTRSGTALDFDWFGVGTARLSTSSTPGLFALRNFELTQDGTTVGTWNCNEFNSGTLLDSSGNGNHLYFSRGTSSGDALEPEDIWIVIPADRTNTAEDVTGNALAYSGVSPNAVLPSVPTVTGDGTSVYVDLGTQVPASSDFNLKVKYLHPTNDTTERTVWSQGASGDSGDIRLVANAGGTAGQLRLIIDATNVVTITAPLIAGSWHEFEVDRSGNDYTLNVTELDQNIVPYSGGSLNTGTGTDSTSIFQGDLNLLIHGTTDDPSDGSISDVRLSTGGLLKTFPLQEGPGSSNTNRDVYWVGDDGTSGQISSALTNGTVATMWGTLSSYSADWLYLYGGADGSNGELIPGRSNEALDALGGALDYQPATISNIYGTYNLDPNGAAEFNGRSVPTAYEVGDGLVGVTPADTAYIGVGINGSGDSRLSIFGTALTGDDKTNMESYVS